MLKNLLGSLRATRIDLVFCAGDTIHFRCSSNLGAGQVKKVRAQLPEGQVFGAKVECLGYDEKSKLYRGRLISPVEAIVHLRGILPLPFEDRRSSRRIERQVRALSPQLQGFSAMTRDLSELGICLVVDQIIQNGSRLQIEMDIDSSSQSPMKLEVEVRWFAADLLSGKNLIGGAFVGLTPYHRNVIKQYLVSGMSS